MVLFVTSSHTNPMMILLRGAVRTARRAMYQDHTRNGLLAGPTMRFMDKIGKRHGVASPITLVGRNWIEAFKGAQSRETAYGRRS